MRLLTARPKISEGQASPKSFGDIIIKGGIKKTPPNIDFFSKATKLIFANIAIIMHYHSTLVLNDQVGLYAILFPSYLTTTYQ